ncbi:MAG: DUF3501 family protein [Acidobacteriota bacterium]
MKPIDRSEILDLVQYEKRRKDIRAELMALKDRRRLHLNPILTLLFENRRTIWYQIQEMMRAERMVEEEAILGEIETYSPLVPGREEWKATLYIEIPDLDRLKETLPRLVGVENSVYARIGNTVVRAAGEGGRSREDYTSTVHYLTFEIPPGLVEALEAGAPLRLGVGHPEAQAEVDVPTALREELLSDLRGG